jgi:hypothetical protein
MSITPTPRQCSREEVRTLVGHCADEEAAVGFALDGKTVAGVMLSRLRNSPARSEVS